VSGDRLRDGALRCAPAAEERGDPLEASAAPVQRWLLVEEPGPWGRDALLDSPIGAQVAADLAKRAASARTRVMLIRRPGRSGGARARGEVHERGGPRATPRRWAVVDSRLGREASWWGWWSQDSQLLDVPLDGAGGERSNAAAYLVCAHGRHDACCAMRGRPVAAAMAAMRPEQVWECSHTGGDRFAANVIVLPHGFGYGHVTAAVAPRLIESYEAGRLDPTWLRGRSSLSAPAQAAQHHARLALGDFGIDAFAPLVVAALDPETWEVLLQHESGPIEVIVRARMAASVPHLTCDALRPSSARVFDLVSLAPSP
jgi:hypothetical protein